MGEFVSVIIPVYNKGHLLLEAIDSVMAQTYRNFEVVVVDDGSQEDIGGMLKKYPPDRVRYIPIPHSGHPSVGRNRGIGLAKGDLIAFLDTDDRWTPDKLGEQVKIMRENPGIGLVSADAHIIVYEKVVPETSFLSLYSNADVGKALSGDLWKKLLFDNFIVTSTVMVRRSLLEKSGLFSTSEKQKISQDYDLWLRIAAISGIYYVPKNLAYYRITGGLHNDETPMIFWDGMLDMFTGLRDYLVRIGAGQGQIHLVNRRIFETRSYISLSHKDVVHSLANLSGYFYYRLRSAVA